MDLKNRLEALRRQAGAGAAAVGGGGTGPNADGSLPDDGDGAGSGRANELRSRLQRLGVRGASALRASGAGAGGDVLPVRGRQAAGRRMGAAAARELAERLGGEAVAEHLVLVETLLPLETRHGSRSLAESRESFWPFAGAFAGVDRILGIDTETTGLAGGTGTTAFMIGTAESSPDGVRLRQWVLTAFAGEAPMLDAVSDDLAGVALLLSYNGKTFDLPLLRDRRRLQRQSEWPEPPHLDLLHPTRRLFRNAWPDCRLVTAEQRLLGLYREDDLPGSEAPRAWRDYLAGSSGDDLERVLQHNALDLLSLLVLAPALAQAVQDPLSRGADPLAAARLWQRHGDERRAMTILEQAEHRLDVSGALDLARALRRGGRLQDAVRIWERLARAGSAEAAERLAKFHEHVRHDWVRALRYTALLGDEPDAIRRRGRLQRRLQGQHSLDLDGGTE